MTKIIDAANEAVAIAKGEQAAPRITINGHAYVPETEIMTLRDDLGAALVRENNALAELEVSEAVNRAKTELIMDVQHMLADWSVTPAQRALNAATAIAVRTGPPKSGGQAQR